MEDDGKTLIIVVLGLIIVALLIILVAMPYYEGIVKKDVTEEIRFEMAEEQTLTGDINLVDMINNTIHKIPISKICGGS